MHDFLTVGAPAPLQTAAAVGFAFGADYYNQFTANYKQKRDYMCEVLREAGFKFATPQGAYYIFADFSELSDLDDVTFAKWMTQEIGVATVPGSSFFSRKEDGRVFTRFAFCKKQETLEHAAERLSAPVGLVASRHRGNPEERATKDPVPRGSSRLGEAILPSLRMTQRMPQIYSDPCPEPRSQLLKA